MKILRNMQWDQRRQLVCCFFMGIVGGTLLCNLMSSQLSEELAVVNQIFMTGSAYGPTASKELFYLVLRQRLVEIVIAWLIGLTTLSVWGFSFICLYYGFSVSVILSMTTMQKGIMALPAYLLSLMPQCLIYLPIFFVLAIWALSSQKKPRLIALSLLLAAGFLGAMLETTINPWVRGLF